MGACDLGGLFFGQGLKSKDVKNHYISLIISLGESFEIGVDSNTQTCHAVLIQKETLFSLRTLSDDPVLLLHIDPYSEIGLQLTREHHYETVNSTLFEKQIPTLISFYGETNKSAEQTERVMRELTALVIEESPKKKSIDQRITKSIQFINAHEPDEIRLSVVASEVFLSPGRFSHLFKESVGISFKQYLAHCKLVRSIKAMYDRKPLTQSSYIGGFSDQPHFTKSFRKSFGIPPSHTKDSS